MLLSEMKSHLESRCFACMLSLLIIEDSKESYIVVRDERQKVILTHLLGGLCYSILRHVARKNDGEIGNDPKEISTLLRKEIIVLTEEEYYSNWEKYSGKRLIFVEEDCNMKFPLADKMTSFIKAIGAKSEDLTDMIDTMARRIVEILITINATKESYLEIRKLMEKINELLEELRKKRESMISTFTKKFSKREADIAYDLLEFIMNPEKLGWLSYFKNAKKKHSNA